MPAGGLGLQLLLVLTQAAGGSTATDSAGAYPGRPLVAEVGIDPDSARARIQRLLAQAATSGGAGAAGALDSAARIARAIARTWGDSFPLRTVGRFATWTAPRRAGKLMADSLRRAGNEALTREGPEAALALWRRSVAQAEAVADTAGIAAGLGNIGAGWYSASELDSAVVYLQRSTAIAESTGDYRTVGHALGSLANVAKSRGQFREAQALFARASRSRARVGDNRGLAADLNNLGLMTEALGQLDSAASLYRRALALNQRFHRDGPAAANRVNLGNLASSRGDYAEAEGHYEAALTIRRARGEGPEQATVLYDLGLLDARRGDYVAGTAHLQESLALYEGAGLTDGVVAARTALSNVYQAIGRVQEAVTELQMAEQLAESAGLSQQTRAEVSLASGDLGMTLNDPTTAEGHYHDAAQLYHEVGDLDGESAATQGLGLLLLRRSQPDAARTHFEQALVQRTRRGDSRGVAQSRLLVAYARQRAGHYAESRKDYASVIATFRRLGDRAGEAAALETVGGLEVAAGNPARAEAHFAAGLRRLGNVPSPALSASLRSGLAETLRRRGALDAAERVLRAAIDELEQVRGRIPLDEWRSGFFADKWSVYAQLVRLHQARGRVESAFNVSERMRARQMLDQLSRGRIETRGVPPELVSEEQDLRRRIMELARAADEEALGLRAEREAPPGAGGIAEELARAQAAYTRLLPRLRRAGPEYAALVSGATVSLPDARRRVRRGELLLDFLVLDSVTVVFALTTDSLSSFELPVSRATLAGLVDFTRGLIASPDPSDSRELWRAPLRKLHRSLLGPVEAAGLLENTQRLIIIPHAELHYLPFTALVGGGERESFLVERFEIVYAPSVSVWVRLGERQFEPPSGAVLAVAPRPTALPGTLSEVELIQRRYSSRAAVLTDTAATEALFRRAAPGHDIVHLASYGVLNRRNPLFSYVQLRSDASHDGRLEAYEAYALGIRPRLLVLSACETGLASGATTDVPAGDEWIGLVQAFLSAGAGSVLATQWRVNDRATAQFMDVFYGQLVGTGSVATALAQAQRMFLSDARSRSPFYWAGFALSGGREPGH